MSKGFLRFALVVVFAAALASCASQVEEGPHMAAASAEEAGRYLVTVGGCNDCHTPGFMERGLEVPEAEWLTGLPVGWRGPWGTSYAPNLRLTVQDVTEDDWVEMLRTREGLPPMPWPGVNRLAESDSRAIYQYIRQLGPAGERMPQALGPDQEPSTPYVVLAPPQAPQHAAVVPAEHPQN